MANIIFYTYTYLRQRHRARQTEAEDRLTPYVDSISNNSLGLDQSSGQTDPHIGMTEQDATGQEGHNTIYTKSPGRREERQKERM